jgi:hypothetical protein
MKKMIVTLGLAVSLIFTAACSGASGSSGSSTTEVPAESGELVLIQVNTEGLGEIAVSEDGQAPVFDEEYPISSHVTNVPKGTTLKLAARPQEEDYQFVEWTKDGELYSEEAEITVTADADTEYIAVFSMSSGYEGEPVDDIKDAKTMGDILALPSEATGSTDEYYARAFKLHGTLYRAVSHITPEISTQLFELDFEDPDYDKKYNEIVAPLAIDQIDDIKALALSQEELDALAGKTVGELMDQGWTYSWYNLEDKIIGMENGICSYVVHYEGEPDSGAENEDDVIRPVTVASVSWDSIGDILADLMSEGE